MFLNLYRLARLGDVQPIGSRQSTVTVGGRSWELWIGMNGSMKVYSYVATSQVTKFDGDLKPFFNNMASNGFPQSSQYLISEYLPRRHPQRTHTGPPTVVHKGRMRNHILTAHYSSAIRQRAIHRQQRQVQQLLLLRRRQLRCELQGLLLTVQGWDDVVDAPD